MPDHSEHQGKISHVHVSTVIQGLPYAKKSDGPLAKTADIVQLCSARLREFVQDADQNLKYLGLVGFSRLMIFDRRAVTEQRSLVLHVSIQTYET